MPEFIPKARIPEELAMEVVRLRSQPNLWQTALAAGAQALGTMGTKKEAMRKEERGYTHAEELAKIRMSGRDLASMMLQKGVISPKKGVEIPGGVEITPANVDQYFDFVRQKPSAQTLYEKGLIIPKKDVTLDKPIAEVTEEELPQYFNWKTDVETQSRMELESSRQQFRVDFENMKQQVKDIPLEKMTLKDLYSMRQRYLDTESKSYLADNDTRAEIKTTRAKIQDIINKKEGIPSEKDYATLEELKAAVKQGVITKEQAITIARRKGWGK